MENRCFKCKNTSDLMINGHGPYRLDGTRKTYYVCRDCNTKRKIAYRKTIQGRLATRESNERYKLRTLGEVKERSDIYTGIATISKVKWSEQANLSMSNILKKYT